MSTDVLNCTDEVWKTIAGYPEYEVSNYGRVRNMVARKGTRIGRISKIKPTTKFGYHRVVLRKDGQDHWYQMHVLVALTFLGDRPSPQHEVAHADGNGGNNHISNLRWATRAENEADKIPLGRTNRGERHGMSKLTAEDVLEIRRLRDQGLIHREIAERFNLNRRTVGDICNNKRWRHL